MQRAHGLWNLGLIRWVYGASVALGLNGINVGWGCEDGTGEGQGEG